MHFSFFGVKGCPALSPLAEMPGGPTQPVTPDEGIGMTGYRAANKEKS